MSSRPALVVFPRASSSRKTIEQPPVLSKPLSATTKFRHETGVNMRLSATQICMAVALFAEKFLVFIALFLLYDHYDTHYYTFWNFSLLLSYFTLSTLSMAGTRAYAAFHLIALPLVVVSTIMVTLCVTVLIQINPRPYTDNIEMGLSPGDVHTGDFLLHYVEIAEILVDGLVNFKYTANALRTFLTAPAHTVCSYWMLLVVRALYLVYFLLCTPVFWLIYTVSYPGWQKRYPSHLSDGLVYLLFTVTSILIAAAFAWILYAFSDYPEKDPARERGDCANPVSVLTDHIEARETFDEVSEE